MELIPIRYPHAYFSLARVYRWNCEWTLEINVQFSRIRCGIDGSFSILNQFNAQLYSMNNLNFNRMFSVPNDICFVAIHCIQSHACVRMMPFNTWNIDRWNEAVSHILWSHCDEEDVAAVLLMKSLNSFESPQNVIIIIRSCVNSVI